MLNLNKIVLYHSNQQMQLVRTIDVCKEAQESGFHFSGRPDDGVLGCLFYTSIKDEMNTQRSPLI